MGLGTKRAGLSCDSLIPYCVFIAMFLSHEQRSWEFVYVHINLCMDACMYRYMYALVHVCTDRYVCGYMYVV